MRAPENTTAVIVSIARRAAMGAACDNSPVEPCDPMPRTGRRCSGQWSRAAAAPPDHRAPPGAGRCKPPRPDPHPPCRRGPKRRKAFYWKASWRVVAVLLAQAGSLRAPSGCPSVKGYILPDQGRGRRTFCRRSRLHSSVAGVWLSFTASKKSFSFRFRTTVNRMMAAIRGNVARTDKATGKLFVASFT